MTELDLFLNSAIPVRSIRQEKVYLSVNFPEYIMYKQTLISKNDRHYDILRLINFNGEKIDIYFDITSFYGKTLSIKKPD